MRYRVGMQTLAVDVWSDIACPWCWVGKRHLEAAAASFERELAVTWHAFELDPGAPKQAPDAVDYIGRLATKYWVSRDQAQAMIDRMVAVGRADGIEFRFDRARPSNTFDAHRLLAWARGRDRQSELKERLFSAYLHEGRAICDHEVLVACAGDVGLDPDAAQAVLSTDAHAADVRADEARAAELGVTGVPFFVIADRYAVPGAQPVETLLRALRRVQLSLTDAPACGPDGC